MNSRRKLTRWSARAQRPDGSLMQPATALRVIARASNFGDCRFAGGSVGAATDDGVLRRARARHVQCRHHGIARRLRLCAVERAGPDQQAGQRSGECLRQPVLSCTVHHRMPPMLSKQLTDVAIVQRIAVTDKAASGSRLGAPAAEGTTRRRCCDRRGCCVKSTAIARCRQRRPRKTQGTRRLAARTGSGRPTPSSQSTSR